MHQLYFTVVPKEEHDSETVGQAMNRATNLLDENSFCNSEGGYFSGSKGDWYEVGGRWSDFLVQRHEWAINALKEIDEYLNRPENLDDGKPYSIRGASYGKGARRDKQKHLRDRCELIWSKHRPDEYPKVPYDRWYSEDNPFTSERHIDDCAELVTPELIEYLKKTDETTGYGGLELFFEDSDGGWTEEWMLKNWIAEVEKNPEQYMGKYWLVVIDYHS